jgi:hypothetical protein
MENVSKKMRHCRRGSAVWTRVESERFCTSPRISFIYCFMQNFIGYTVPHPPGIENRRSLIPVTRAFRCSRLCIILGLCFASSALAYTQDPEQGQRPTLVRGAFTIYSLLGIQALDDSNIFQSATDAYVLLWVVMALSLLNTAARPAFLPRRLRARQAGRVFRFRDRRQHSHPLVPSVER